MKKVTVLLLALSMIFVGCEDDTEEPIPEFNVASVSTGPTLDGSGDDAAWESATAYTVENGMSADYADEFGQIDVTLKAVQDGTNLYMLASWADATENVAKNRLTFSAGAWSKSGNEDRVFFMFDIDNGTEGADCATMCHSPDPGLMYTTGGGEVDVWHWKAARTNPLSLADDKHFDATGRQADDKTISAYGDNYTKDDNGVMTPKYTGPLSADGNFIIIAAGDSTANLTKYTPADTALAGIPGYYLNANATASGEARHQVGAKGVYANGMWTLELKRALNTSDADDAVFTVGSTVKMTMAVTDNSGGNHSGSAPFEMNF